MANTSYKELIRQVLLSMPDATEGEAFMLVKQSINVAHKIIASLRDFDDLMVLDTTHALTVIDQKMYHIETDLLLVRPKDIYSIRYMDDELSRKLIYVPFRELDEKIPYTEQIGTGRPKWYTRRGKNIELYRIPDAAKSLYIMHSQWPAELVDDTDLTPYSNLDHVIVPLAVNIASDLKIGNITDWTSIASKMLSMALSEESYHPDEMMVAQPFTTHARPPLGETWNNPFIKSQEGD